MVKVGMRYDDRTDTLAIFFKIRGVRERIIGARYVVFFFEMEARVHHDDVAIDVNGNHVATDFFDTAERDDTYNIFCRLFGIIIGGALNARTSDAGTAENALNAARSVPRARAAARGTARRAIPALKTPWRPGMVRSHFALWMRRRSRGWC